MAAWRVRVRCMCSSQRAYASAPLGGGGWPDVSSGPKVLGGSDLIIMWLPADASLGAAPHARQELHHTGGRPARAVSPISICHIHARQRCASAHVRSRRHVVKSFLRKAALLTYYSV